MALGGGIFTSQNKVLPGAYINFVSASRASATLGERGVAAFGAPMSWCEEGKVITLSSADFLYNSLELLGYPYDHEKVDGLREAFKHATTVLLYRTDHGATKATCTYGDARYGGKRGNDLYVVITANADEPDKFDVKTYVDLTEVDVQTGVSNTDELQDNAFIIWKADVDLALTAKTPLTGGANGALDITGYQSAMEAFEGESFNCIAFPTGDSTELNSLVISWVNRMRDEVGVKFQAVLFKGDNPDNKGIINVVSEIEGDTEGTDPRLVYWVTGAQAGCAVNASLTNFTYDGEFSVNTKRSQSDLEDCIKNGQFVFHKVGDTVRVLTDINSKVTTSDEENEDFKSNQTIRVIDQIATDIAVLFNDKYLGKIPNDNAGRISLWNDIVKHHQDLERLRAIEDFDPENVVVEQGDTKKSVVVSDRITPVNAMEQLYMTCVIA